MNHFKKIYFYITTIFKVSSYVKRTGRKIFLALLKKISINNKALDYIILMLNRFTRDCDAFDLIGV